MSKAEEHQAEWGGGERYYKCIALCLMRTGARVFICLLNWPLHILQSGLFSKNGWIEAAVSLLVILYHHSRIFTFDHLGTAAFVSHYKD